MYIVPFIARLTFVLCHTPILSQTNDTGGNPKGPSRPMDGEKHGDGLQTTGLRTDARSVWGLAGGEHQYDQLTSGRRWAGGNAACKCPLPLSSGSWCWWWWWWSETAATACGAVAAAAAAATDAATAASGWPGGRSGAAPGGARRGWGAGAAVRRAPGGMAAC